MGERLLQVAVVAELLGVSRRTVYRMVEEGKIGSRKIYVRSVRIPASEVQKILKAEE